MSGETFHILQRLAGSGTEKQVVLQCAPLLTGIKLSNLLNVRTDQKEEVFRLFAGTAVSCREDSFSADVMHETLNRSSLAQLRSGSHVNLERAMPADGRFGGHIVAGHVDGVGRILGTEKDGTAVWYRIGADQSVLRYVVEKGSVAVDGISLTVAAVTETDFSVSLIPHTARMTILGEKKAGDPVNLETDIVGKYVEKLMKPADTGGQKGQSGITREFLEKYGF